MPFFLPLVGLALVIRPFMTSEDVLAQTLAACSDLGYHSLLRAFDGVFGFLGVEVTERRAGSTSPRAPPSTSDLRVCASFLILRVRFSRVS